MMIYRVQHECRKIIPTFLDMISELKQSAFKALASFGKTLTLVHGRMKSPECGGLVSQMELQKASIVK